jgi:hypothetical protein
MTSDKPAPQQQSKSRELDDEGNPIESGDLVIELRTIEGMPLPVPYVYTQQ